MHVCVCVCVCTCVRVCVHVPECAHLCVHVRLLHLGTNNLNTTNNTNNNNKKKKFSNNDGLLGRFCARLLFDAEQEILRRRYNIVCHPIGTLPNHTTQNIFKGVPYVIDQEAVCLLLEFDKVQLWKGDALSPLIPSDTASLQRHRLDSIILQVN